MLNSSEKKNNWLKICLGITKKKKKKLANYLFANNYCVIKGIVLFFVLFFLEKNKIFFLLFTVGDDKTEYLG